MPKLHTQDHRSGAALVIAGILAIVLPLCLIAGTKSNSRYPFLDELFCYCSAR